MSTSDGRLDPGPSVNSTGGPRILDVSAAVGYAACVRCVISLRVLYHDAAGTMQVIHEAPTVISNFIHIAVKRVVIWN